MKKLLVCIGAFLASLGSYAQQKHIFFDRIDILQGLPENTVRALAQDAEGYMWMATQNGLVRYDGYRYKVYNLGAEQTNIATATNVISLIVDRFDNVWVTSNFNGLFRYDRATDTFQQFSFPSTYYTQFEIATVDKDCNVWGQLDSSDDNVVLARFNLASKKFELFGTKQKGVHHLNATAFNAMQTSATGVIWIATNNGVYRYNGGKTPFTEYFTSNDSAKQLGVGRLYEAPSRPGVFWMNTFHGQNLGLKLVSWDVKSNRLTTYSVGTLPTQINSAVVNSIYEDKHKQLWFATDSGLSKLDRRTGRFSNFIPKDTLKNGGKTSLSNFSETTDGSFWLQSSVGLIYFDTHIHQFQRFMPNPAIPGNPNSKTIVASLVDKTGTLWLGYDHAGGNKINRTRSAFTIYKNVLGQVNSYPGKPTSLLPLPGDHNLVNDGAMIYKWTNGVDSFEPIFTAPAGEHIRHFVKVGDELYMATTNGLREYDLTKKTTELYAAGANKDNIITSKEIFEILYDHAGIIWLGTINQGLFSFDPKTKKLIHYPFRQDGGFTTPQNNGKLDDANIAVLYEDHENNLWIGTNSGSLNRFDSKTGKIYSYFTRQNRAMTCTVAIFEDSHGRLWVGNYLEGLFLFDKNKGTYTRHFTEQNGLLFNSVLDIAEDKAGNIWLQSERGLSRLDPKTWVIKNFPIGSILPGYQIPANNVLKVLSDGSMSLSLNTALAVFNPANLADNPYPPEVHIEEIAYSDPRSAENDQTHVIAYGHNKLALRYDQNRVQFTYIALHYDNPQSNKYAYKLDGYDKQWVQAGTQRTVTYNNLAPGTYTFHVIAANSSDIWNNNGDTILITISTPWWERWWAWFIYVAGFAFALSAFVAYRSKKLQVANALLEEKVSLRTQQLSYANQELSEQQEEITAQRDQLSDTLDHLKNAQQQLIQSEKLASLGELTAGIAHEIQNPLNFVNNFSEVSMELADEIAEELNNGNTEDAIAIARDIKQNLSKILHHGKRADFIVKGMLQHSRTSTGERQFTDINMLADEFFKLSFHGLRAKDKSFNAEMLTNFNPKLPKVKVVQQDLGRVLLNLFNNAFYAVQQKQKTAPAGYRPEVAVSTFEQKGEVVISVKDNGIGIPDSVKEKIMQPFFTTKPTGEGTGLGLSLSYDIIVKGNSGSIDVQSKEGEFTEIIIRLPV